MRHRHRPPRPPLSRLLIATLVAGACGIASTFLSGSPSSRAASLPLLGSLTPLPGSTGYDISWPQCPSNYPHEGPFSFRIIGVNGGKPWTTNPCLATEYATSAAVASGPIFYLNTANPGQLSAHWGLPGPRPCEHPTSASDEGCAYDYGWNGAANSLAIAAATISPTAAQQAAWWLDVETENSWLGSTAANGADLEGVIAFLRSQGIGEIGVYSTRYQWGVITGGLNLGPSIPDWVAGAANQADAASRCSPSYAFSGGPVALTQYPSGSFDGDLRCPLQLGALSLP